MLQKKRSRKAGAVVELAVSLPLLLLLVMGSVEACTMIFLDHSLTVTAYEGIRVAVRYDSTNEMTLSRCEEIIEARRINGAVVEIVPDDCDYRFCALRREFLDRPLVLRRPHAVGANHHGERVVSFTNINVAR